MTIEEALEILKKRNIHRGYYDTERLILRDGDNFLNGEQIGVIDLGGIIYLCDYIPSVIGKSYWNVRMTGIHLSKPDAPEILSRQIDLLDTSAERYDEETRHERASAIRKYFNNKRISAEHSQTDMAV